MIYLKRVFRLLSFTVLAGLLLSACSIEITGVPETNRLQTYTISGLPQLNYASNYAGSIVVDNVFEFSLNGVVMHTIKSNNNLQIAPFTFEAYPEDTITIRAMNLNEFNQLTGCGIGNIYLLTSGNSHQLSEAASSLICSDRQIFYDHSYDLSSYR